VIYKKFKDGRWEKHHMQFDSLEEEEDFVEFLKELYPEMTWVSIRIMK